VSAFFPVNAFGCEDIFVFSGNAAEVADKDVEAFVFGEDSGASSAFAGA
jgi:hypothetical protein